MARCEWVSIRWCHVLVLFLALLKTGKVESRRHYRYSTYLDSLRRFHLWWDVNYKTNTVNFRLLAVVTPDEWFGVGYSQYGKATNADYFVHWTDKEKMHHCKDAWTDKNGLLHIDDQQDYTILSGRYNNHAMIVEYERSFDTCDNYDFPFDNGTIHITFFIGKGQFHFPEDKNVTLLSPDSQRIFMLKPDLPISIHPKDTWTFTIVAPKVTIPAAETTYWWYTTKLPAMLEKHHIIQFEGHIMKGNEDLVHHIEVFHCEVGPTEKVPYYNGPGLAEGKPKGLEVCRKVIGAWAMGAAPLQLPSEAGYPVGGPRYSSQVLLEVHYNNPSIKRGIKDSSGIKFYVTPTLRKFDAGIMEVGIEYINKMAIPPRQKTFKLVGDCISECTNIGLPPAGIHIFASQLHTHLTGKKVYIQHVRNGKELPLINYDYHYSPHFQTIKMLQKSVHIRPGDALVTTCEYDTTKRMKATIGGFAISDEMCVSYLHYYPLCNLEVCKSSIETKSIDNWLNFMKRWDKDKTSKEKGYRDNFYSIRWTPLTSHLLDNLFQTSPLSMQCNKSDGTRFPGRWEGTPQTQIKLPLQPTLRKCSGVINDDRNVVIV